MCDDDDNDGDVRFELCAVIYMSFLCANLCIILIFFKSISYHWIDRIVENVSWIFRALCGHIFENFGKDRKIDRRV